MTTDDGKLLAERFGDPDDAGRELAAPPPAPPPAPTPAAPARPARSETPKQAQARRRQELFDATARRRRRR